MTARPAAMEGLTPNGAGTDLESEIVGDEPTGIGVSLVDPLIGRLVDDRYRVRELIAAGGMAKVYRADDERLERRIALKIINGDQADEPRFAAAFAHEAKTIAQLSHPNVVAVFDQGDHDGLPYVVMEYVPGITLRDLLNRRGRLEVAEALDLVDQILAGLAAAHRIGLVHRDVKPENILISTQDGRDCVKVADFGLAQAVQTGRDSSDTGPILATVAYVPPEVLTGGSATARCDVYSVGILLFELLTGSVPFDDADPVAVALMHVERDVPHPSAIRPEVSDDVDALVKRCTRRRPADRPADALSVARLLRRIDTRPSRPRAMPRPRRAARNRALRHRRLRTVAQLTVATVVLLIISAGGWWLADGRYTQAPSLLHQDSGDIEHLAAAHGMSVTFADARFSESVPEAAVLAQEPGPGERIRRDGVITVTLSKGPERYEVPDLVGVSLPLAQEKLAGLTLVTDVVERRWDDSFASGVVIGAEPEAGAIVRRGAVVGLVVSDGPPPAEVPDLTDADEESVVELVDEAGLRLQVERAYSDEVPGGRVISQAPPPGTGVDTDTEVTVTISRGATPVEVPDLVGLSLVDAKSELADVGLTVAVKMDLADGEGSVFKQTPEAGQTRPRGSEIALYCQ